MNNSSIKVGVVAGIASLVFGLALPLIGFELIGRPYFNLLWGNVYGLGPGILQGMPVIVNGHKLQVQFIIMVFWPFFVFVVTTLMSTRLAFRVRDSKYFILAVVASFALCMPLDRALRFGLVVMPAYFGM